MVVPNPIIIDRGKSFLGFLSSPAIFPTLIHPSYAHSVPKRAAPNPDIVLEEVIFKVTPFAVPFINPKNIIAIIGINLAIVIIPCILLTNLVDIIFKIIINTINAIAKTFCSLAVKDIKLVTCVESTIAKAAADPGIYTID